MKGYKEMKLKKKTFILFTTDKERLSGEQN